MNMTWNTIQNGRFYHPFENKDTLFWFEVVYDLAYEFCSCVENAMNNILPK